MNKLSEVVKYFMKQYKIQLENNKNNRKLKKYYVDTKTDKRSNMAKVLDYVGIRVIVFFVLITFFLIVMGELYGSLGLALLCTTIFHIFNVSSRNKRINKMIYHRRKYLASIKVYKDMMNRNMKDFNDFLHEILMKSGFNNIQADFLTDTNILLKSTYNGIEIPILCKKYNSDQNVQLNEVQTFQFQLEKMNLRRGLMITTSDFTSESIDYIGTKTNGIQITLIEKDRLLKIIDKGGMFPTDKEMDEYIVDKVKRQQKKLIEYKKVFLAKNKTKKYVTLSFVLLMWAKFTAYPLYYLVVSLFLLGLALVTIYSNIKNRSVKEKEFSFDELIQR